MLLNFSFLECLFFTKTILLKILIFDLLPGAQLVVGKSWPVPFWSPSHRPSGEQRSFVGTWSQRVQMDVHSTDTGRIDFGNYIWDHLFGGAWMIETIVFLLYSSCCTLFIALFLLHSFVALFLLHSSCCTLLVVLFLLYLIPWKLLVFENSINIQQWQNEYRELVLIQCMHFLFYLWIPWPQRINTNTVELMCFSRCVIIF